MAPVTLGARSNLYSVPTAFVQTVRSERKDSAVVSVFVFVKVKVATPLALVVADILPVKFATPAPPRVAVKVTGTPAPTGVPDVSVTR
jgi:hypothetical protein